MIPSIVKVMYYFQICKLFLGIVLFLFFVMPSDCKSLNLRLTGEQDDIRLIEKAIDALPENYEIDTFLLQEVKLIEGYTQYKWLRSGVSEVAFSRSTLDNHLSHLIFPMGEYFGRRMDGSYTVLLRNPRNLTVYYLTAVYVRNNDGLETSIEWTPTELWLPEELKVKYDMCQGRQCGLAEMLLGTCFIVERKCPEDKMPFNSEIRYNSLFKNEETEQSRPPFLPKVNNANLKGGLESDQNPNSDLPKQTRNKRMVKFNYYDMYLSYMKNSSRTAGEKISEMKRLRVPTSFDLLEMLVESTENGTDFLFKNRIDRRRKRKIQERLQLGEEDVDANVEQLLHTLTCFDCHTLGAFYSQEEEDPVYSQVLGAGIRKMVQNGEFGIAGRKSKSRHHAHNHKSVPFIGFGKCTYEMKGRKRPVSLKIDDIIDFYLRVLKIDCKYHEKLVETVRSWFTAAGGKTKFFYIQQDSTVRILPGTSFMKSQMLSLNEYETLLSGLLFSKFTSAYLAETLVKVNGEKKSEFHPVNLGISKEIKFLSRVFLESLDSVRLYLSHHLIKLTRSLARLLKNKFIALLVHHETERIRENSENGFRREHPSHRADARDENFNDRQQIMALKEFILYGLGPILRSATPAPAAFLSFYSLNANRIKLLVDIYDVNLDD